MIGYHRLLNNFCIISPFIIKKENNGKFIFKKSCFRFFENRSFKCAALFSSKIKDTYIFPLGSFLKHYCYLSKVKTNNYLLRMATKKRAAITIKAGNWAFTKATDYTKTAFH